MQNESASTSVNSDVPIQRPKFLPFKEGTAPEGFVAKPEHTTGGLRPELAKVLTPDTPAYIFMAEVGGFDAKKTRRRPSGESTRRSSRAAISAAGAATWQRGQATSSSRQSRG